MPELIAFEGTDRSGKETQSNLLYEYLSNKGYKCKKLSFPNYDNESSLFLKNYLLGKYENYPLNEYSKSMLFALDRVLSFNYNDLVDMDNYDFIIFDRWIGSNLIYQGADYLMKTNNDESSIISAYKEVQSFVKYWYNFEVSKLRLPEPDITIFLDMPVELGKKISEGRKNKINNSEDQDINESNDKYMNAVYKTAELVSEYLEWDTIKCYKTFNIPLINKDIIKVKSIEEIHKEVVNKIINFIPIHQMHIPSGTP